MRRALLSLLIGVALLSGIPAEAFWQSRDSNYNVSVVAAGGGYTGPIDVVASPTALYSLRAGSAAIAAAGTQTLVNIRRASDNVACDFLPALNGGFGVTTATCNSSTQGGVSYSTFAPTDATASCTIAGTAVACTGASATLHVNDPITGVGITNPCVVTVTNGSTTATASLAGTSTSCGTVSVAETVTFQVAGFVPTIYDQSGASGCGGSPCDATQATAGNQPLFLPNCGNSLPCIFNNAGTQVLTNTTGFTHAQPNTASVVADRLSSASAQSLIGNGTSTLVGWGTASQLRNFAGSVVTLGSVTDGIFHSEQNLFSGASSVIYVDGTSNVTSQGTNGFSGTIYIGNSGFGGNAFAGYFEEAGEWRSGFTGTNDKNMCTNQSAYYSLALTCN